ncbi:hypothetical protein ABVK25_007605 [Lepraria finkii]|uniref:Uncharacterized protein n=1 Tax=Lepraria finkii TaxID=1340010 RepID=A0ABR4B8K8_9LECA
MGKAPPVPPRVTQSIYDAEAKILCASNSIPDLKSYAAVSPENRYQRSGTPIPDSTSPAAISSENQDQRSNAPMPGSASAAATGSPYDPQIFVKKSWDGSVPSREQTPSLEDGMTDDLCGLHMSAKKARELGHAMGFSADHLTNKVCTGSIQRQQSKDKIARNTVDFKSSKSKASIAMRSSSHTKSPKLADHFGFFAMPGESQEDFSQSHFSVKERHNPDTSVPGIYNGHAIVRITVRKTGKDGVLSASNSHALASAIFNLLNAIGLASWMQAHLLIQQRGGWVVGHAFSRPQT